MRLATPRESRLAGLAPYCKDSQGLTPPILLRLGPRERRRRLHAAQIARRRARSGPGTLGFSVYSTLPVNALSCGRNEGSQFELRPARKTPHAPSEQEQAYGYRHHLVPAARATAPGSTQGPSRHSGSARRPNSACGKCWRCYVGRSGGSSSRPVPLKKRFVGGSSTASRST